MSEIVPYKGGKTATRGYKARVVSLEFAPGKATKVRLENKLVGSGVCLGCEAPRCKTKDAEELALPALLSAFPGDPSFAVCPTSAIDVSDTSGVAVVDSKKCIGCGLCVVRCPYGAISMYSDGTVSVATADPDGLTTPTPVPADTPNPLRSGRIGVLAGDRAQHLLAASTKLADSDRNLFVRNLLHEVGLLARVRRRGDVNVRIDAVGSIDCLLIIAIMIVPSVAEHRHGTTCGFCGSDRSPASPGAALAGPGVLAQRRRSHERMRRQFGHALAGCSRAGWRQGAQGSPGAWAAARIEPGAATADHQATAEGRNGQWLWHRAVDEQSRSGTDSSVLPHSIPPQSRRPPAA